MNNMLISVVALALMLSTINARAEEASTLSLAMRQSGGEATAGQLVDKEQVTAPAISTQRTSSTVLRPVLTRRSLTDDELGLTQDASFRRATGIRADGIVLTAVGLAGVAAFSAIAIATATAGGNDGPDVAKLFGLGAGVSVVPALIGAGLWYNGQQTINTLRE
jgi:hypothetical protein